MTMRHVVSKRNGDLKVFKRVFPQTLAYFAFVVQTPLISFTSSPALLLGKEKGARRAGWVPPAGDLGGADVNSDILLPDTGSR
jgi:hypothetical protein